MKSQTENQSAQGDLYRAQAEELRSRIPTTGALGLKYKQETETGAHSAAQIQALTDRLKYLMPHERQLLMDQAFSARKSGVRSSTESDYREDFMRGGGVRAEIARLVADARRAGASAALDEYAAPAARNQAEVEDSWWGKNVRAYGQEARAVGSVANSAFRARSAVRGLQLRERELGERKRYNDYVIEGR